MSQTSTLKGQCIAEFLGTGLLIFFGVGCVSCTQSGRGYFWSVEISIIWGLGVYGYLSDRRRFWRTPESSSHNRTMAVCVFDKRKVVPVISQIAGAFCAAATRFTGLTIFSSISNKRTISCAVV